MFCTILRVLVSSEAEHPRDKGMLKDVRPHSQGAISLP